MFYVYPTAEEVNNKAENKKIWKNDWTNKPVSGKRYLMIGSRGTDNDQVWYSYNNEIGQKSSYELLYGDSKFGRPDHSLWYLLGEME